VPVTGTGASAAEARRNALERAVAAVVSDLVPEDQFEEAADVVLAEPERYVVQLRIASESRDDETGAYRCVAKPEIDATAIKRALRARGLEVE
jgi:hypothetical protein